MIAAFGRILQLKTCVLLIVLGVGFALLPMINLYTMWALFAFTAIPGGLVAMFGLVKMLQYLAIKRFGVQLDARMLSKQAGSALSYIFLGGFLTFQSWIELSTFGFDMFGAVLGLVGVALLAVQIYRVLKGK